MKQKQSKIHKNRKKKVKVETTVCSAEGIPLKTYIDKRPLKGPSI